MMIKREFDWFEYIVFLLMLGLSTLIGVFFCCHHGGQKTVSEYLLGNKKMQTFPIAMSLIASSISGITLLGLPAEIYGFGLQFYMSVISDLCICLVTIYIFLPVFYNLQLVSLYQYLEMRFNHWVRKMASMLFTISLMFFLPIVIYGPAIAFNQVSGLSTNVVAPLVCAVCIFYTTFGGLKAVVWTDVLQGLVMLGSIVIVCIMGVIEVGGVTRLFSLAKEGGRLEVLNLDPDPTVRLTLWSATFGVMFQRVAFIATSPASIQRFVSLPNYSQVKRSVVILLLGGWMFSSVSVFLGLIIYSKYYDCDPKIAGHIQKPDQLLPFFVLDVAGHMKGLPGLFVAGIVCAALSSLSTGLNTLSGTIYEDFIEPLMGKTTEERASGIMKIISVVIGVICVSLVNVVENMGEGIVELTMKFTGVSSGAIMGIFILGVLVPHVNSAGVLIGAVSSLLIMSAIMIGRHYSTPVFSHLPVGSNCSLGFNVTASFVQEYIAAIPGSDVSETFLLFRISVFYYAFMGVLIVIVIGISVAYLTGPNDLRDINPELIAPFLRRFLPKPREYNSVPQKETDKQDNVILSNRDEKLHLRDI